MINHLRKTGNGTHFLPGRQGHPDRPGVLGHCVREAKAARGLHQHCKLRVLDTDENIAPDKVQSSIS